MMSGQHVAIQASALCEAQTDVARAVEALSRAAAGLCMDGISVQISAIPYDPDEETSE
jgi:hypothetical protein